MQPLVAAVRAGLHAAENVVVDAVGTGVASNQGWPGSWQTAAEQRGLAWVGARGNAGKAPWVQRALCCPEAALVLGQRTAAAESWSYLTKLQQSTELTAGQRAWESQILKLTNQRLWEDVAENFMLVPQLYNSEQPACSAT